MSVLAPRTEPVGAGVPYNVYLGLIWATEAMAAVFLTLRLFSRWKSQRRIFWDDVFVTFAFLLTLVTAILWQWQAPVMYWILGVDAGTETVTADIYPKQVLWLQVSLAVEIFFYTSLTAVKLSLLFFFRRMGNNVSRFNWYWWPVTMFVLAIWVTTLGNIQYKCEVGSIQQIDSGYCTSWAASSFTSDTLKANAALDVLSDLMIILIPVWLLWDVQMQFKKKMALIGLFSVSVITMAIAIARAADLSATMWVNGTHDPTYLWLWSAIEPCIAITVSCLSAFPQLFKSSEQTKKPVFKPTDTYYQRLVASRIKSKTTKRSIESDLYNLSVVSVQPPKQAYDSRLFDLVDPYLCMSDSQTLAPNLVPGELVPRVVCYASEGRGAELNAAEGQITREREYQVTRQWA